MSILATVSAFLTTTSASLATRCIGGGLVPMRWLICAMLLMALVDVASSASGTIRVTQDDDVIFLCDTPDTDVQSHLILWHRGHMDVSKLGSRFFVNPSSGSLTISTVRIEDEGNYTCSAGWGRRFEPYTVILLVLIAPRIRVTSDNPVSPRVMETLTLSCRATGKPLPSVFWFSSKEIHINSSLTEPGSRFSIKERQSEDTTLESILVISPVFAEDRGTFACRATNVVSNAKDNVVVDVQQKPVILSPPTENILVYWWEGHKANLTCQAVGNPAPSINWVSLDEAGNAKPAHLSPVVDVKNGIVVTSTLWLSSSVSFTPPATYRCTAENTYGVTPKRIFTVRKGVVPPAPVVRIISIKDDEVILTINVHTTQATPPVTYVAARYRLEESVRYMDMGTRFTGNGTRLVLGGIMLFYHYIFKITVFNMVGESEETILTMYSEEKTFTTPSLVASTEDEEMFDVSSSSNNMDDNGGVVRDKTGTQGMNKTLLGSTGRALESANNSGGDNSTNISHVILISTIMFLCVLLKTFQGVNPS